MTEPAASTPIPFLEPQSCPLSNCPPLVPFSCNLPNPPPNLPPCTVSTATLTATLAGPPVGLSHRPLLLPSSDVPLNLRPGSSLCLGSPANPSLSSSSLALVTPPLDPICDVAPSCSPLPLSSRRRALLHRYSSAKSAASGSLSLAPLSRTSSLSVGPLLEVPLPSGSSFVSCPHDHGPPFASICLASTSLPSDVQSGLASSLELGSEQVGLPASEEEDASFDDPIYREKMDLLGGFDGDTTSNQNQSIKEKTVFHCEAHSPPVLYRKTPHHH